MRRDWIRIFLGVEALLLLGEGGGVQRDELCLLVEFMEELRRGGQFMSIFVVWVRWRSEGDLGERHRRGRCVSGGRVGVRVLGQLLVPPPEVLKQKSEQGT